MIAISNDLNLDDLPQDFIDHIQDMDLTAEEKVVWNFHRWLREETSLYSGTILDYRQAVYEILVEDKDPAFVTHAEAAVQKLREYADSGRNTGDAGE